MKKIFILAVAVFMILPLSAQNLKFGHVNMQEIIFLMEDMDSARVTIEKYNKDINDTYNAMMQEYRVKMETYQQMSANWTASVLEAKAKELQDIEARIQKFQQDAQIDIQNKQQEIMRPITLKANEAVNKVGKANGFIYIFDVAAGAVPFVNEMLSVDVTNQIKKELNIPLDKKLPAPQQP